MSETNHPHCSSLQYTHTPSHPPPPCLPFHLTIGEAGRRVHGLLRLHLLWLAPLPGGSDVHCAPLRGARGSGLDVYFLIRAGGVKGKGRGKENTKKYKIINPGHIGANLLSLSVTGHLCHVPSFTVPLDILICMLETALAHRVGLFGRILIIILMFHLNHMQHQSKVPTGFDGNLVWFFWVKSD